MNSSATILMPPKQRVHMVDGKPVVTLEERTEPKDRRTDQ